MGLSNTQIAEIIAKRKAIKKTMTPLPTNLEKNAFKKGVENANEQIEEWEKVLSISEVKEICEDKFHKVNKMMFTSKNAKNYSFWLGVSCAFGRYYYSGEKIKL